MEGSRPQPSSHRAETVNDACPSPVELVQFAAGELSDSEAERLSRHWSGCARCRRLLAEAAELDSDTESPEIRTLADELAGIEPRLPVADNVLHLPGPPAGPPKPDAGRRWWQAAIAAAALLAAGTGLWQVRRSATPPVEALLADAYTAARPFDWRLPDAGYAPVRVQMGDSGLESSALQRAGIEVSALEATAPGQPSTLARLGRLNLLRRDADAAVAALEHAHQSAPGDEEVESDLAVAYALRARMLDRKEDYDQAIRHFSSLLRRRPDRVQTLFNRAVTYRLMGLKAEARLDFEACLKRENSGPWADEARDRLSRIQ